MKVRYIVFGSIVGLFLSCNALSKDLETCGATFKIMEQDLLEVIANKLQSLTQSGAIEQHQKLLQAKMKQAVFYPKPILLPEASEQREFYYDPTLTVEHDLIDHKGQIFHKKGEQINPLKSHKFRGKWIFFDPTSKKQRIFAKAQYQPQHKLILTNGSPLKLMAKWQIPLYFDQYGILIKKFAIKQLPAIVEQHELKLKIVEVDLSKWYG